MQFVQRQITNIQLTSIERFSEIISVWIRNEIFRFGFSSSIIEFTHMRRHHKIEALATVICTAAWQTVKANIGLYCFVDVSLQHPSTDGPLRWALLSRRFLNNMTNRKNSPEPEKSGHFLTVMRYLKEDFELIQRVLVYVKVSFLRFLFSAFEQSRQEV